jgi:chromosome segregation protein
MYLKEIKTHGFKSFADKITLDLNPGITGIVGPNGSGKSNIVDAVRWVLGEQSIKSLRGDDTMTDVIFSGSKSRDSMNAASVALIFDNADRYLPIDYQEVSIKRRVYIDGTNEYFINNEKCRLKDITSMLLDTGIAKESFNIISQGKIEEIISNKPSERRIVFEEAAGVLKYKKRKEEALRKLEKTHLNMQRVNDVINEIETNLEPLKEQSDKAIKYLEFKKDLEEVEIALITKDITDINNQYQKNKQLIEEINSELMSISTTNATNEAKIEDYKLKINNIDLDIEKNQKILLDLTTKVEQINSQKQIILERKKYEVDDAKIHDNLVLLKESELKIKNDINKLELELNNDQTNLNNILNNHKEIENIINNYKDTRTKLEIELANDIRYEVNLKNKIEALKSNIDNNTTLSYAAKSVLSNPKIKGVHNAIGNLLDVEEKYANAISTALGMSSGFLVVDDEKVAKEAINYLKTNNLGRATFFPLNIIKDKYVDATTQSNLNNLLGFVGIASKLVKYDSKYQNIIANQLGNVIVASDLDSANQISKIINYQYKIVTLDGELIHVGGSLTGGSLGKVRNIINDKYELESTILELNNKTIEIKNLEEKINSIDYELRALEDKNYLISKDKINLEQSFLAKHNQLNGYNDKLITISRDINSTNNMLNKKLSEEEETILNSYYEAVKEKDNISNSLSILSKKRHDLNFELEEYSFSLKKENTAFLEKSKILKNLEIEVNRMDVKLDNLLNTLSESYGITYDYASQNYHLETEESLARTLVNRLKREIKELGIVNIGAKEEYERVSTRYNFLTKQKEDLFNAENTLLEIIKEMDSVMEREFLATFNIVRKNFTETFKELFKGGNAELKLTDSSNLLETGIEIIASPPGKKLTSISLLSGGEKTLTAISLLFAILKSRDVPFCILDEAEAALDEVNADSFGEYITKLKSKTQFIIITHKKKTMEFVDTLYGITMQESGVSKLVSVKLEDIKKDVTK